eukprot:365996-Chlamydomonas_euryale.AAC.12
MRQASCVATRNSLGAYGLGNGCGERLALPHATVGRVWAGKPLRQVSCALPRSTCGVLDAVHWWQAAGCALVAGCGLCTSGRLRWCWRAASAGVLSMWAGLGPIAWARQVTQAPSVWMF